MKSKKFKFKKGEIWDGDEQVIHYLEDELVTKEWKDFPEIKQDTEVIVIISKKPSLKGGE